MIKVLFFIESLSGGGAEKVLRNLVNNMDQGRFDITVATVYPVDAEHLLVPGIRYKSMFPADNRVNRLRYRLEAAAGLSYALHLKDDYDVECAYLECGTTKIIAGSTNKKAKKIAWVHCDLERAFGTDGSFAAKCAPWYAKYDRVACVSQRVKESYVSMFGDTPKAEVVYNSVDSDEILQKAQEPLPAGVEKRKKTVLLVGRLSSPKNILRMLKAHQKTLADGIDHDLWIVGEGEERAKIEAFIAENGLQDSVTLFGFQNNPYAFMREADIMACSSDYEGFSTFVTEALILGKPIVTTDVSGMRELLGDSEFGLITAAEDEAFCEGLKSVLQKEDAELRQMHIAASQRGKTFETSVLVKQTELFLEGL